MKTADLNKMNEMVDAMNQPNKVKYIKTDNGLFERVDINKVVLTENNKMLLND
jgi:hypothetical protein